MRGFGFQLDIASGRVRNWYAGEDGVQRWVDSDQPCNYTDRLEANFTSLFGDIKKPDPIAVDEAVEGIVAMPQCECSLRTRLVGDGCQVCNHEYAADHTD